MNIDSLMLPAIGEILMRDSLHQQTTEFNSPAPEFSTVLSENTYQACVVLIG